MELLKRGTPVRLIQPVIEGEVIDASIKEDAIVYKVMYTGIDGELHEREFRSDQLEITSEEE